MEPCVMSSIEFLIDLNKKGSVLQLSINPQALTQYYTGLTKRNKEWKKGELETDFFFMLL
jgi:hypothetical protein